MCGHPPDLWEVMAFKFECAACMSGVAPMPGCVCKNACVLGLSGPLSARTGECVGVCMCQNAFDVVWRLFIYESSDIRSAQEHMCAGAREDWN